MCMPYTLPLHPGGINLTQEIFKEIEITNKYILDVGCGAGQSVLWLCAQGAKATGVDTNPPPNCPPCILQASAENLPFAANSQDIILLECTLSVFKNPLHVLQNCRQILKPNGLLIVADMYATAQPITAQGTLKNVYLFKTIQQLCSKAGFTLQQFTDYAKHARTYFATLLFYGNEQQAQQSMGISLAELHKAKCSYFAAIFS